MGRPASWSTTSARRSSAAETRSGDPPLPAPLPEPVGDGATPCHAGRNRASVTGSTGSTSRRSFARERRRSSRRTSGSQYSRSAPPGRNAPDRSDPAAARRWSASSTTPTGNPHRRAGSEARNGPCVRADRARSPSSAPATGARNAPGTPGGADTPTPSRYRATSSIAIQRSSPAIRARTARRLPASSARWIAASTRPPAVRAPASSEVRSPRRRSRSWTWSGSFACRSSTSAWRLAPRSASASGSSSSRSSSWPRELPQQVPVQRERLGASLGHRGVAVVHVGGDVVEQERAGERGGSRRLHGVNGQLPPLDPAQDLAERRQVEDVREALPVGLHEDREAPVPARHREEVRGALALLPERGPGPGTPPRQEQGPGGVLAEPAGEQARLPHPADHQVLHLLGVREEELLHAIERAVALGQADRDPVVGPDGLDLETETLVQPRL